jgi:hypothetical protein
MPSYHHTRAARGGGAALGGLARKLLPSATRRRGAGRVPSVAAERNKRGAGRALPAGAEGDKEARLSQGFVRPPPTSARRRRGATEDYQPAGGEGWGGGAAHGGLPAHR